MRCGDRLQIADIGVGRNQHPGCGDRARRSFDQRLAAGLADGLGRCHFEDMGTRRVRSLRQSHQQF